MRKRDLSCRPVSVRPSDTFECCIQTAEDNVKILSRPGSPIILVFDPNSKGNTLSMGAIKIQGVEKNLRFSTESARRLSWKWYDICPWMGHGCYRTLIGSHMRFIEW